MRKIIFSALAIATIVGFSACKQNTQAPSEQTTEEQANIEQAAPVKEVSEVENLAKPYNETEDAQAALNELVAQAKAQGKYVFVQAGGNWCIWCLRFNEFVQQNQEIKKIVDDNFVYYHLNYSQNNKNREVFNKYAPKGKEFGFPFFFVIDQNDQVTNVFGSGELEAEKSYDVEKVKQMFLDQAPKK